MALPSKLQRRIFDLGDPGSGPTLVTIGGVHGDEPAGVEAMERLARHQPEPAGRMLGLTGNIGALRAGTRYIDVDLNRCWTEDGMAWAAQNPGAAAEHGELLELLEILEGAWRARSQEHPFVVLDLHTTSGAGPPFAMLSTREDEMAFGRRLPIVKVLGIERYVNGALLSFLSAWGAISLGFEGGQHQAPDSVEHHRALMWVAAVQLGLVEAGIERAWVERLQRACREVPGEIRVVHRHEVRPRDGFTMRPGHYHLEPIKAGLHLANDGTGAILAPVGGYLLMPSYGPKGEDGFFIGQAV
ncbi:MAG: succinylglutamate desuccinylase/aspartoacylase family protein [Myxococcota bacterium]